ncbi:MAG: hypothetical protein BWY85_00750 [Firmicutes bacterium ADurb.Bin506]|nr:MAG: hypothetical protein BWY85_00750 [Firmicutes bacterium ADurb.Bin506]
MISTRCCSPTESCHTFALGLTSRPYLAENSLTSRSMGAMSSLNLGVGIPRVMFSATVKVCTSLKCWCTMPIPSAIASAGERIDTRSPLISISPESGRIRPVNMFISVLLPAPFSPRRAWISPRRTHRFAPLLATTPGNRFVTLRISTAFSAVPTSRPPKRTGAAGRVRVTRPADPILFSLC